MCVCVCRSVSHFHSLAGAGLASVIYAEVVFKALWAHFDHGWSIMVAWVGAAIFLLGFAMSLILVCLDPRRNRKRVYSQTGQVYNSNNQGYDKGRNNYPMSEPPVNATPQYKYY